MRVALYARVSTQRQAQAQTVEQQVERLTGHVRQQNWTVPLEQVFRSCQGSRHPAQDEAVVGR